MFGQEFMPMLDMQKVGWKIFRPYRKSCVLEIWIIIYLPVYFIIILMNKKTDNAHLVEEGGVRVVLCLVMVSPYKSSRTGFNSSSKSRN